MYRYYVKFLSSRGTGQAFIDSKVPLIKTKGLIEAAKVIEWNSDLKDVKARKIVFVKKTSMATV